MFKYLVEFDFERRKLNNPSGDATKYNKAAVLFL